MCSRAFLGTAAFLICLLNVQGFNCPADRPSPDSPATCGGLNDMPCEVKDRDAQCVNAPAEAQADPKGEPDSTGFCCYKPFTPPTLALPSTTKALPPLPTLPTLGSSTASTTTKKPATSARPRPTSAPKSNTCVDLGYDCTHKAYLCNNSLYRSLMTIQCPRTCGFCGQVPNDGSSGRSSGGSIRPRSERKGCRDIGYDCPHRAYLCNNKLYHQIMTVQCPMTCGRC
uniref:ShTK domain protein n=1 Tax=Steinernema glaseri TaxID=37863 RepID=A0A1I8AA45_9BILA